MKPNHKNRLALLAALAASMSNLLAGTGSLDKTFSGEGKLTASFGGAEGVTAIALAPNGKIVVAGTTSVSGSGDIAVLRYNSNGTLDTTFSNDGATTMDIGTNSIDAATGVAVQADGKIVVVGKTGSDSFIARFNVDGTPDTFFGGGGKRVNNFGGTDQLYAVKVMPNGTIYAAGGDYIGDSGGMLLVRYLPDGSLDTSFDSNGWMSAPAGADDVAMALAVQSDGKILIAGYSRDTGDQDFAIARVNSDGERDNTYAVGGTYTGTFTYSLSTDDRVTGIVIQSDGKAVLGGSYNAGNADFALLRMTTSGALDTSFGDSGSVHAAFSPVGAGQLEFGQALALQPDGKFLIAGSSNQNGSVDFGVMRFNSNGTLDKSFSGDGKALTDFNTGSTDYGQAMLLQSNGKLLVGGASNGDFAIARYDTRSQADLLVGTKTTAKKGDNVTNSSGYDQTLNVKLKKGSKKISYAIIQNESHFPAKVKVKGTGGNKSFTVRYLNGKKDVTEKVKAGTFTTKTLAIGAKLPLTVEITATTSAKKKRSIFVTGTPAAGGTADTVLLKASIN